jgi:outer membrane protein insertion porin family
MTPRNLTVVIFLLLSVPLCSQIIHSVSFHNNKVFTAADYENRITVSKGSNLFEGIKDTIAERIFLFLKERGYYHSKIDSISIVPVDTTASEINVYIQEDFPSYIKNIFFEGLDSTSENKLFENYEFLKGNLLSERELTSSFETILAHFENAGYPFVKVLISSIKFEFDSSGSIYNADLYLKVERSTESIIEKIEVAGNNDTKDFVILREINVKTGERYSYKKIREIPAKLNRLRFFDPVQEPLYYFNSKNEGILKITVKEKSTNNFDGVVGYVPGKNDDAGYVTGLVNVSMRNLFGTGRAAAVKWQKIDRYSQELELRYLEPYLFGFPFNIQAEFYQKQQDTTYVQRKVNGSIEYMASEEISFAFIFGMESVIPTLNEKPIFTVYNSSLFTTGVNVKIDTRDDPYAPTRGLLFINSYSYSRKNIKGPDEFITPDLETKTSIQRITLDFSFFYELFRRQIIAIGLHGKELQGTLLEVSDLYRLGGTNSLRGYRENQFVGSRIFWSNTEYRLLLTQRTYAFLFFDTGYYLRKANEYFKIQESSAFKIGYGLGLSLETGLGILAVSYALAKGESFSEGKIHFGLINDF